MANTQTYDTNKLGSPRVMTLPVAASQTFSKGEFLIWTATGLATITAGTNYAPTSDTTRIAGRAVDPSVDPITGTAYTSIEIEVAEPGTRFSIPLYHATPASAVIALSNLGKAYELRRSTAVGGVSFPQVDISSTPDSTNGCARVMEPTMQDCPTWNTGSVSGCVQYANVYVEFKPSACQFSGGR